MSKNQKKPWPTKDVMNQIYEQHLWGGHDFDFYSGAGSYEPKIIESYLNAVISFLKLHNNNLTVCDFGCGDFNIGKHFVNYTKTYIAIDIVETLIERNIIKFQADQIEFLCLDLAKDKLPSADCIILRQVLQHLSNAEIKSISKKLSRYKHVILTEHLPIGNFIPNKDIISGQGIRLKQNSGVDLLESPFNLKISEQSVLNKIELEENKGQIVTTLYNL